MTREEAIKNIKENCYFANLIPQAKEALDMAIKALEQEPSREFEDYENCKECRKDWTKCGTCSVMMQWLKDNKQEPCEDCISREELDKALYENFHEEDSPNNITDVRLGAVRNFIRNFPSINPQEPKLDTLNNVRAEIVELDIYYDTDYYSGNKDAMFKCNDVLRIIDKYKGESEE